MVKYSCKQCGKEFSQKSRYDSHNKRKTPCKNNADKIKAPTNKATKEKLKNINKSKLIIENEEININTEIMDTQQSNQSQKIKIKNKNKNKVYNKLKFIDLCCGIGGFHYALKNMGHECVMASDINEDCRTNYEINHKIKPLGDLTKIDIKTIPNFDVLCAGFPCQPFSKAGEQKGFKDKRGNIFFEICKIIKYHKPKYLILENVRNLASHDNGNTWDVIKTNIDKLNYNTYDKPVILNTLYFGVPQSRARVVIMCKRKDLCELPKLPSISKNNIKITTLKDIIDENVNVNKKYNLSGKLKETEKIWNNFLNICATNNIIIPRYPIWTDWWDSNGNNTTITKYNNKLNKDENEKKIKKAQQDFYKKYKNWIDKNREFYKTNINILNFWLTESRKNKLWLGAVRKMEWQAKTNNMNMNQILWSPRGSGVRIKNINYSPTLVAMASMIPIYGPKSRYLTPRECARLQSFPEEYIPHNDDKISYKQFGNAVNVKMIERSARFLIHGESLFM
jgi:DNA (cytosine-5)-methyltransferase 1